MANFMLLNVMTPQQKVIPMYVNIDSIVSINTEDHIIYLSDGKADIITGESMKKLLKAIDQPKPTTTKKTTTKSTTSTKK